MSGSTAKQIRRILNFEKKGEHPYLDLLYKRTKRQYKQLSWNAKSVFLKTLQETLNESA